MTDVQSVSGGVADIDFGDVAGSVNDLLQTAVSLYRHDRVGGEAAFRAAAAADPQALAPHYCLYKILAYQGRLEEALAAANAALALAARQAGLDADWRLWRAEDLPDVFGGPVRFALYTMKALAFIHLKRGEPASACALLDKLRDLGRLETVGGGVIAELAAGAA